MPHRTRRHVRRREGQGSNSEQEGYQRGSSRLLVGGWTSYPNFSRKRSTTFCSTSAIGTSRPSSRTRLVTPYSRMPQGVIRSNQARSVFTFRAKPWEVIQPDENFTPMAAIFFSPTHTPVYSGWCQPSSP